MIEEARRLPPSMLAVGIAFVSLFIVLALGLIAAVMADDTPQVPALEGLPVIDESEVVDSISTCTDSAPVSDLRRSLVPPWSRSAASSGP